MLWFTQVVIICILVFAEQKCQNLKLTPELIEELEKGTSLSVSLQLPSELAFHPEWLGDSFISKDNVQLLSHLRYIRFLNFAYLVPY